LHFIIFVHLSSEKEFEKRNVPEKKREECLFRM